MKHVTSLHFTSFDFLAGMYPFTDEIDNQFWPRYYYNAPSQAVQRAAAAVAAQGAILPVTAPSPNSSWTLEFDGPALRCREIDTPRRVRVEKSIANHTNVTSNCYFGSANLAWYRDLPFSTTDNGSVSLSSTTLTSGSGDNSSTNNATMSLAVLPMMLHGNGMGTHIDPLACDILAYTDLTVEQGAPSATNPLGGLADNSTMIDCQLFNTTYTVAFEYTNGDQKVSISASDQSMDRPVATLEWVTGPSQYTPNQTCLTLGGPSDMVQAAEKCSTLDSAILRTLTYQAIMEAFTGLIAGNIANNADPILIKDSNVVWTTLLNTKELHFLSDRSIELQEAIADGQPDLQAALANSSVGGVIGLTASDGIAPTQSLAVAIEEMFQNYTLWLAYGLAILCTAIAVVLGFLAILSNGASYSNNFSTITRSARNAELSVEVEPDDTGRDPLPRGLAKAIVVMPTNVAHSSPQHSTKELTAADTNTKTPTVTDRFLPPVMDGESDTSR
ncbi:hypothetical protein LTR85_000913 [Meristemomyces frigidus]|nr:hypothetical protein LTR85_000913 [Meristemomyces frigidus]